MSLCRPYSFLHDMLLTTTMPAMWTFYDSTFVLLPVMVVWRLQMALRQRISIVILVRMGLVTTVLSILKTIGLSDIAHQENNPTATNVLYNASLEILYSLLEQAFAVIMGCILTLRAIAKLDQTQSIGSSLATILRRGRSSKSSSESLKYDSNG